MSRGGENGACPSFFARPGAHSILSLPFCGISVFKIVVGIPKSVNLRGETAETLVMSGHHTGVSLQLSEGRPASQQDRQ